MRNSLLASTAATAVLACGLMGQPALGKPAPTGTFSNAFCHAYPGPSAAFMYLLTDGTVLVHDQGSGNNSNWYRLTPDNTGSYTCGTWTPTYPTPGSIASIPSSFQYGPRFYAAAVLPDGSDRRRGV